MRRLLVLPVLLILVAGLALYGCRSGSSSTRPHGAAMMNVRLTDTPIDLSNVQSINVTLTNVTLFPEDEQEIEDAAENEMDEGAPVVLMSHPETFDLMKLMGGVTALLTSGQVPPGEYHLIRLEVSSATLVYKDGTTKPLTLASNTVDIPIEVEVEAGTEHTVTLDFDAAASIQVDETGSGTFILKPVVKEVD